MVGDSALRSSARAYVDAAMSVLESDRPVEDIPAYGREEWVRVDESTFRWQPRVVAWWETALMKKRDRIRALPEHEQLLIAISADPQLGSLLGAYVGTQQSWRLVEPRHLPDKIIWAVARRTGVVSFDHAAFDEEFEKWNDELRSDHVLEVCLAPFVGLTTIGDDIELPEGAAIARFDDHEIARLLSLGFQVAPGRPIQYPITNVPAVHGLRVRRSVPRLVRHGGWDTSLAPPPWATTMNDLTERVLVALRLVRTNAAPSK